MDSGGTDKEEYDLPPTPVPPADSGEQISERLSEAGYAGGPLRVAAVECRDPNHVVVHLELQKA